MAYGFYKRFMRKHMPVADVKKALTPQKVGICALIVFGVSGISLLWLQLAGRIPSLAENLEVLERSSDMMSENVFLGILLAVIIAPIIEELIFRGVIFQTLEKIKGGWFPVICSSLLFGLGHGIFMQIVYCFIMGLVLAIVYKKTRNIMYPILIHASNNFVSSLLDMAPNVGIEDAINVVALILIVLAVYFFYNYFYKEVFSVTQ